MAGSGDRLLRLLAALGTRPWATAAELAADLGVTTRTIRRDVADLRALGYPVQALAGPGGGYGFGRGGRLPPLLLDEQEAVAVAVGLRLAARTSVTGAEEAAASASAKLERLLSPAAAARAEAVATAVVVLDDAHEAVDADLVAQVADAVARGRRLRLAYTDRAGRASDRRIDPLRLVHVRGRWYLVAHDVDKGEWRTLRLDRVARAQPIGPAALPSDAPDPLEAVGLALSTSPYRHRARIHVAAPADVVAARVPAGAGVLEALEDGCLLTTGGDDLDWMTAHLLVLDLPFTVLEPDALRQRTAAAAARLAAASALPPDGPAPGPRGPR